MDFKRSDRVADSLKVEISDILLKHVKDPRIKHVTITEVKMTDDLRLAKVYFVPLGEDECSDETQKALEKASGFLKRELGKRLRLRYLPEIRFIFDKSFGYGDRIEKLITEIRKSEDVDRDN